MWAVMQLYPNRTRMSYCDTPLLYYATSRMESRWAFYSRDRKTMCMLHRAQTETVASQDSVLERRRSRSLRHYRGRPMTSGQLVQTWQGSIKVELSASSNSLLSSLLSLTIDSSLHQQQTSHTHSKYSQYDRRSRSDAGWDSHPCQTHKQRRPGSER